MSILFIILIVIATIVALLMLIATFTKKEYVIEREVAINRPKQDVFDFVRILKNQDHYNKWWMMDPNVIKSFKGTDGTVGFVAAWDSANKKVGKGEQEVKKITAGERIDFEIRFIKPFEGVADTYMTTETAHENKTKVKWVFSGKYNYPMNIMLVIMNMDKLLGKDMEESLSNLKAILEK